MVELAIVLPVLLIVLIGVVQFALVYHARDVATTAAQEGARLAAAEGRTPEEGADRTRDVLESGLGETGAGFSVTAEDVGRDRDRGGERRLPADHPLGDREQHPDRGRRRRCAARSSAVGRRIRALG